MRLTRLTCCLILLVALPSFFPSFALSQERSFTFYNAWCMGYDGQWSLEQPWFISAKTYATQVGNTSCVIIFMGNEIIKSDHLPYLSITKQYADNGGSQADSLNFLWNGAANPGSGYADWVSRGGIEALRDSLHAKGKKIILCLQAVDATLGYNDVVSDSVKTEVFTQAVAGYVNRHNFDGADLNVELGKTTTVDQNVRFFRILRRNMPSPKLILTTPPVTNWPDYVGADSYVDYVLPQCYAYVSNWQPVPTCSDTSGNGVFLKAPLHRDPFPPGGNHQDLTTWGPNQWYQVGWPKSKIVILLSNEANPFSGRPGNDTLFSCAGANSLFWSDTVARYMLAHGGTETWDDVHVGSYIHGTSTVSINSNGVPINLGDKFIIPILSDRNIDSVVAWGRENGYSNFGLYDISTDAYTPAVVKTPRHAHLGSVLTIAPFLPMPIGTFTSTPSLLAFGGGTVTLRWTSVNAQSASIDNGIGAVQLNDSLVIAVTSTTVFTITFTNADWADSYTATAVVAPLPPLAPLLSDPVNGATAVATNATLAWSPSSGATSYRVQASTDPGFGTIVVDQPGIAATSYTFKGLMTKSTFYWRVSANNLGGTSDYSATWTFTTAANPAGLVAAYAFEEGAGITAADSSGYGNTATIVGGVGVQWTTHDRYGNAVQYNLAGAYADLGNPLQLRTRGSMSWSAWVKALGTPLDDGQIIAKANNNAGWQIKTSPDVGAQTFAVGVSSDSLSLTQRYSNTIRALNTWYHVAGVYDSAARTLDIYVNGILDNGPLAGTVPSSQYVPNVNVNIARRTGGFYFNGIIDEVRIYNRALTREEILSDMNTPLGVPPSPPGPPALAMPTNLAVGVALAPMLSWDPSSGGSVYRVQVSTAQDFSTTLVLQSGLRVTSYGLSGLTQNTTYYWRVSASDTGGSRGWSNIWSFTTQTSDSIDLPQGWNMISSFIQPNDSTLGVICSGLNPNMMLMKNGKGGVYWPAFGINTIGTWVPCDGYQIYMQSADTLAIIGSQIQPQTCSIPLTQHWNLVGYVRSAPMRIDSALVSIISDTLLIAKNNAGDVFWPLLGINTIGSMMPRQGYLVFVSKATVLTYPGNTLPGSPAGSPGAIAAKGVSRLMIPQHYPHVFRNTGVNAIVLVESKGLPDGDELAVWTSQHVLVGSGVSRSGKALLTVWGVNALVKQDAPGAREGEELSLSVWSIADQRERPFIIESVTDALAGKAIEDGRLRYTTNAAIIVRGVALMSAPTTFDLSQNYPNPFNPSTLIQFQVPVTTKVHLKVYDILGRVVRVLVDDVRPAGAYTIQFNGSDLASGVYIYRLEADNFVKQKKLLLLK